MTPEQRLAAVQRLAVAFAEPPLDIGIHAEWQNELSRAGIHTYSDGATVFVNNAEQDVANFEEAQEILRQIFADEIVSVTAYDDSQIKFCVLAPASNPSATFPAPSNSRGSRSVPDIDNVMIECWSSGLVEKDD